MPIKDIDGAQIGDAVVFKAMYNSERYEGIITRIARNDGDVVELSARTRAGLTHTVPRGNICNVRGEHLTEESEMTKWYEIGDFVEFRDGCSIVRTGVVTTFMHQDKKQSMLYVNSGGRVYDVYPSAVIRSWNDRSETISDEVNEIVKLIEKKIQGHEQSIENLKKAKDALLDDR